MFPINSYDGFCSFIVVEAALTTPASVTRPTSSTHKSLRSNPTKSPLGAAQSTLVSHTQQTSITIKTLTVTSRGGSQHLLNIYNKQSTTIKTLTVAANPCLISTTNQALPSKLLQSPPGVAVNTCLILQQTKHYHKNSYGHHQGRQSTPA